jgi:hypothetical protein
VRSIGGPSDRRGVDRSSSRGRYGRPSQAATHRSSRCPAGGPEGDATRFAKQLPLYAAGRPSVSILGAGYVAAERKVVVGTRVDFGCPVPADEQEEFENVTDAFASVTARRAGSTLAPAGPSSGWIRGYCQIFPIPVGSALTDPLVVEATYPGYKGSPPATTTATVRPEARVENRSLASCVEIERRWGSNSPARTRPGRPHPVSDASSAAATSSRTLGTSSRAITSWIFGAARAARSRIRRARLARA